VAAAACEQSGRNRVPRIAPVRRIADWLGEGNESSAQRFVLSLDAQALDPAAAVSIAAQNPIELLALSGPEGGLSSDEEALAKSAGFQPISLGARVLRADTAPLALLAWLAIGSGSPRL
jgi:16S rRNA (uracil1498-N3)-methyltransferase